VDWDFGGGAQPNHVQQLASSVSSTASVQMLVGEWTARATVHDALGMMVETPAPGTAYVVAPAQGIMAPEPDPPTSNPLTPVDASSASYTTPAPQAETEQGRPIFENLTYDPAQRLLSGFVADVDPAEVLTLRLQLTGGLTGSIISYEHGQERIRQAWLPSGDHETFAALDPAAVNLYPFAALPRLGPYCGEGFRIELEALDVQAGANGQLRLSLTNQKGQFTATPAYALQLPPVAPFPYATLAPDTLYAIPLVSQARVGEPVPVIVATGVPAGGLVYMSGVGLSMPRDGSYVRNSFNLGLPNAPGVSPVTPDGFWAAVRPSNGFILAPDSFIVSYSLDAERSFWGFNVTPIHTSAVHFASGALFYAEFAFATPGVKRFGFTEVFGVKRTYYEDNDRQSFWGDSTALPTR
jgi:hypothetical protein